MFQFTVVSEENLTPILDPGVRLEAAGSVLGDADVKLGRVACAR